MLTEADVDAVMAAAIELGSANLTYVWEDSTPGEQALMAGMAAAMHGEPAPVTLDQVREAWRTVDVPLPGREAALAAHSLISREVVAGNQAFAFTIDLQRLWLEQHRRLEWVKEELDEAVHQWKQTAAVLPSDAIPAVSKKISRRRYLAAGIAVAVAGVYLVVAAVAQVPPFSSGQSIPQSLIQLLPGDLSHEQDKCHIGSPPAGWNAPGLTLAVHCTDSGLPGGNVYGYQMDNNGDFAKAWQHFNSWWKFRSQGAASVCPPPTARSRGIQVSAGNIPRQDQLTLECEEQDVNGRSVPAMALSNDTAFVLAQGTPGSSLKALNSWWSGAAGPGVPVSG